MEILSQKTPVIRPYEVSGRPLFIDGFSGKETPDNFRDLGRIHNRFGRWRGNL